MARLNLQSSADGAGGEVDDRRRAARDDPEHVRADRRAPPDRGEEGRPQDLLRLGRPAGGGAADARRHDGERRGADRDAAGQFGRGRRGLRRRAAQGRRARHHQWPARGRSRRRGEEGRLPVLAADGERPGRPAGEGRRQLRRGDELEPAHHLERAGRGDLRRRRAEGQGAGHASSRSSRASTSSAAARRASSRSSRRSASRRARTPSSASAWRWRRPTGRARR